MVPALRAVIALMLAGSLFVQLVMVRHGTVFSAAASGTWTS